ncbi:MAG: M15 family metallopeptidase [Cyclobacteriaceae bacterium]|nr:M15 family metallopeptidase [Cyclobacteriaceae bacterium]
MARIALFFNLWFLSFTIQAQLIQANAPYLPEQQHLMAELLVSFEVQAPIPSTATEAWSAWSTVPNFTFGKDRGHMVMINDLDALHPYFREKVKQLIVLCRAKGIELAVVETYRTHAKQNEYKSMGKKYTRSGGGKSKHQYGLAVDVVPVLDSVAQWHDTRLWKKIGTVGEQLGLRWGGRWRSLYDPGHFEWTGGLSGNQLSSGYAPHLPKTFNSQCIEEELAQLEESWQAWEAEQATSARQTTASVKSN